VDGENERFVVTAYFTKNIKQGKELWKSPVGWAPPTVRRGKPKISHALGCESIPLRRATNR
jgi:hypothetical protein